MLLNLSHKIGLIENTCFIVFWEYGMANSHEPRYDHRLKIDVHMSVEIGGSNCLRLRKPHKKIRFFFRGRPTNTDVIKGK